MSTVRVGLVGTGAIAQVAHLPVLSRMKDVELVGVCDSDFAKARTIAARFQVADVYEDIEDLLRDGRPDAVAICTPNHLHEVHVETALSAGAHVLCERPLALSVEGVQRVIAIRQRTGRAVMVGMNHRFRGDVQAVRGFVRNGGIGTLRTVRCGWYTFRPTGQISGWRQQRVRAGGGAMLDLGLSVIDLALWLAGCPTPRRVSAVLHRAGDAELEDAGAAMIVCEGGISIFVDVARDFVGDAERLWLDLLGKTGSASINPLRLYQEARGTPSNVTPAGASGREDAFTASYRAEWAHFLAIARGQLEAPDLSDQLLLHRALEAVYRSADQGRDVAP
ncbi:MAG: Gfo/Idh/MocA family oxidoreductase [Gemmatimonadetes bacterium]|nr:Gfo/Idh/MocA family oxidoreductase [Gemmatimonadota bacterium]